MLNHKRRLTPAVNANKRIPEGLGALLLEEVKSLPVSRKAEYLKQEFLTKFVSDDTDPSDVRRSRAIAKWLATEERNEATNERLINTHPDFNLIRDVEFQDFVEKLQSVVSEIIGDTVPSEALIGSFSGGASTSRSRTASQPAQKYLGLAHVTERCSSWLDTMMESMPGWAVFWGGLSIETVPGNVMFTVPKTTLIDRCACKEPDVNMFLQKGAGRVIRRSLLRCGVDLNDQSVNQRLAREGSKGSHLATIDLSSASDSVSRELVFLAVPIAWWTHLDSLRCHITSIDGKEHVNEMFSSMGNGFTFELESLLFYALARTTAYFTKTRGVISVYGDDLIVPVSMYQDFEYVLSYFGFQVNPKKSFAVGTFRESCGGHFDNGYDITPFYVKEPISTLSDLIKFANAIRRWSEVEGLSVLDEDAWDLWSFAASFIPLRFWGGHDCNTRYQLCSPGLPRDRLDPVSHKTNAGAGGYFHWLNSTVWRDTLEDGITTSEFSQEDPNRRMRIRRASRTVNLDKPVFPREI